MVYDREQMVWDERLATTLEADWNREKSRYDRHMILLQITANLIPEDATSILDVGCGFGDLWPLLRKKGFLPGHYLGIDASISMRTRARKKHPELTVKDGNVFDLAKFGRFDCVVANSLLVHLWDIPRAVRAMWVQAERVLICNFVTGKRRSQITTCNTGTHGELIHHVPVVFIQEVLTELPALKAVDWRGQGDNTHTFRAWKTWKHTLKKSE